MPLNHGCAYTHTRVSYKPNCNSLNFQEKTNSLYISLVPLFPPLLWFPTLCPRHIANDRLDPEPHLIFLAPQEISGISATLLSDTKKWKMIHPANEEYSQTNWQKNWNLKRLWKKILKIFKNAPPNTFSCHFHIPSWKNKEFITSAENQVLGTTRDWIPCDMWSLGPLNRREDSQQASHTWLPPTTTSHIPCHIPF